FIVVLLGISTFMALESWKTFQMNNKDNDNKISSDPEKKLSKEKKDDSAFSHISKWVQRIPIPPYISLPASGLPRISLWAILAVALVGGFFSGFLGGGAGYIRMPAMVYLLGIPTHVAVGTDLFEIMISASYGTWTHAIKGNVDILIALVMHTGAAIGAQIGAGFTQYFAGAKIRLAFIPLPLLGAGIIIYGLLTGKHH
ncbi:MAG: sulfite exporter TauE/SafE family protein, partial [Limisphaerales bacterium]